MAICWKIKWFLNNTFILKYSRNWSGWCFYYRSHYIGLKEEFIVRRTEVHNPVTKRQGHSEMLSHFCVCSTITSASFFLPPLHFYQLSRCHGGKWAFTICDITFKVLTTKTGRARENAQISVDRLIVPAWVHAHPKPIRCGQRDQGQEISLSLEFMGIWSNVLVTKSFWGKLWGFGKDKWTEKPSRYKVKIFPIKKDRGPNNDTATNLALCSRNLFIWPKTPRSTHFSWKAGDGASVTGIFLC